MTLPIIEIDPILTCSNDVTTFSEIFEFIKKQTSKDMSSFCLEYQKFSIYNESNLSLPECGFDPTKKLTFKEGTQKRIYFTYNNFNFHFDFFTFKSTFDVRLQIAEFLHTVVKNIDFQEKLNERIDEIKSDINNPIHLKFADKSSIYKVYILPTIEPKYYYMSKSDSIYKLKTNIAAERSICESGLIYINDNQFNDDTELECIKNNTLVFNYNGFEQLEEEETEVTLVNIQAKVNSVSSLTSDPIKIKTSKLDIIFAYIEQNIGIDRQIFRLNDNQILKIRTEIEQNKKCRIDIQCQLKFRICLSKDKKHIGDYELPLFVKTDGLKKFIGNQLSKKDSISKNFGIVINKRFINNNEYVIKYLTTIDGTNEIIVVMQENESNVFTFESKENKKKCLFRKDSELSLIKTMVCPKNPASINLFYDGKIIEGSQKFNKIDPKKLIFYQEKALQPQYVYKGTIYGISDQPKKKIKDIFVEIEERYQKKLEKKDKKDVLHHYDAISTYDTNNCMHFNYYSCISDLNFGNKGNGKIYISKSKEKINYRIYDANSQSFHSFDSHDSIFTVKQKLSDVKSLLKQKFKYGNHDLLLFSDFAKIEDSDFPLLCFPNVPKATYIVNMAEEQKTLIFKNPIFQFQITFNNKEFANVPKRISRCFGLETEDMDFAYSQDSSTFIHLPPSFSAGVFKNNTSIKINFLKKQKEYIHNFKLALEKNSDNISMSSSNENLLNTDKISSSKIEINHYGLKDLYSIKLRVQKVLNLLNFSPNHITFNFLNSPIKDVNFFDCLIRSCIIEVNTNYDHVNQGEITCDVEIFGETRTYYLIKDDRIKVLKDLIAAEKEIADAEKIKILNPQGNELLSNELIYNKSKFKIEFPTINIICEGSLANQKPIEIIEFFRYEKAKGIISKKLNIEENIFSLFVKNNDSFKEILSKGNPRLPSQMVFAHKILSKISFYDINTEKKLELPHFLPDKTVYSELCSLSYLILPILSDLQDYPYGFSLTPDDQNEISEDMTYYEYSKKQKEKDPNSQDSQINYIYIFSKQKARQNKKVQKNIPLQTTKNDSQNDNSQQKTPTLIENNNNQDGKDSQSTLSENSQNSNSIELNASNKDLNNKDLQSSSGKDDHNSNDVESIAKEKVQESDDSPLISNNNCQRKVIEDIKTNNHPLNENIDTNQQQDEDNNENEFNYKFVNHFLKKNYEFKLPADATVKDAKIKISDLSQPRNVDGTNAKINFIELIYGGRKLKNGLKMKAFHFTDEDQIEFFIHDYSKRPINSLYGFQNK